MVAMGKGVNWLAKGQAGWQRETIYVAALVDPSRRCWRSPATRPVGGAACCARGPPQGHNVVPLHRLSASGRRAQQAARPYADRSAAPRCRLAVLPVFTNAVLNPRPLPAVRRPPPRSLRLGGNGRFRCRDQRPRLCPHLRRYAGARLRRPLPGLRPRRWKRSSAARSTSSPSARSAIHTSGRQSKPPANPSMTSETRQRLLDALSHVAPPRCFSDCQEPFAVLMSVSETSR